MKIKKAHLIFLLIILLFPLAGICFYPHLPPTMATHWSTSSQPDGYMSRFAGTFITALVIVLSLIFFWIMGLLLARVYRNEKFEIFWDTQVILLALFMFYTYLLVLLWNVGFKLNILLFILTGSALLIIAVIVSILYIFRRPSAALLAASSAEPPVAAAGIYRDKLVEIDDDSILFRQYHFFGKPRKVPFSHVEYIRQKPPTLWNGKWRLHGTGDFRTWFPADFDRPSRDTIFVMKLKNQWTRIGFTVENSAAVSALFKNKGLL